jgi:hypothetical protein
MKEGREKAVLNQIVSGSQEVVQATQSGVELYILECPRDPKMRDGMGGNFEEILLFIKNSATLGFIKTTDAVQKTGFSCSIGTDDT